MADEDKVNGGGCHRYKFTVRGGKLEDSLWSSDHHEESCASASRRFEEVIPFMVFECAKDFMYVHQNSTRLSSYAQS